MNDSVVVLTEGKPQQEVSIPIGMQLQKQGICDVALGKNGNFVASNFSKVGLIRVGDQTIEIRPKISVMQVLQLIGADLTGFRSLGDTAEIQDDQSWTFALVDFFVLATEYALSRGPHHDYVSLSESSRVLRGRIDFSRQAKRSPGILVPLEVDYDEHTPDIPHNKILKTAIEIIKGRFFLLSPLKKRVLILDSFLKGVSPLHSWRQVPEVTLTRLTDHYKTAIALANLIIRFSGLDSKRGDTTAQSFLLNMEKIFEKFVENEFKKLAEEESLTFNPQGNNQTLDSDGYVRIRPDYLWSNGLDTVGLADAKYKHFETKNQIPNQDVYQMVTYCTRYGISDGFLLYASSPEFTVDISGSPIRVHIRQVDLGLPIEKIRMRLINLQKEINSGRAG